MTPDISSKSILIIGGSAGSLQVVLGLLSALKTGFPMPVLIVLHRNGVFESSLEELLSTRTTLPIREVEEKDPVLSGTVYVCPADYHVLLEKDRSFSLDYSERVHYSRPSIDVTFRSGADIYGVGVIGLLLSGGNADGTEGLQYIRDRGGLTVVQDPPSAEVPYMPQHAISHVEVDIVLPAAAIPEFIKGLYK